MSSISNVYNVPFADYFLRKAGLFNPRITIGRYTPIRPFAWYILCLSCGDREFSGLLILLLTPKKEIMKKHLLTICTLAVTQFCYAQNCIEVTDAAFNPGTDGSTWKFDFSFIANGNKALEIKVNCGATVILDTCFTTNGSGSASLTGLICPGGSPALTATFTPHTGNCTSATCGPIVTEPPSGGPLPINMSSFFAQRKNTTVNLGWQTQTEINAKEFVIQRFTGGGFVDVATIPAYNNSTGNSYTFTDINSFAGISQYRLKMVDRDGSFTYSGIRAVKGTNGAAADFTIFPNPASGNARVMLPYVSGSTDVQLVDNTGRLLKIVTLNNSSSNIADFNNLQRGMYLVRVINKTSGEIYVKRLSVIN
jgi:hypothetical protein